MPIYEYKCSECEAHFEKMQKVSEEPLKICEACGGKLEKQWSLSGFQFKGAGWYVTDYSNKSKEPSATKTEKSGDGEKSEKTEKSSAGESTATTDSASNKTSETATPAKKDAVAKKE